MLKALECSRTIQFFAGLSGIFFTFVSINNKRANGKYFKFNCAHISIHCFRWHNVCFVLLNEMQKKILVPSNIGEIDKNCHYTKFFSLSTFSINLLLYAFSSRAAYISTILKHVVFFFSLLWIRAVVIQIVFSIIFQFYSHDKIIHTKTHTHIYHTRCIPIGMSSVEGTLPENCNFNLITFEATIKTLCDRKR